MSLDLVNQHVAKILLAAEDGDSISRISQKAGGSYGWTHQWIERLEEVGVVERTDGVSVRDDEFRDTFKHVARTVLKRNIDLKDAYLLPNFAGMDYRYSRTDAVFIWTKGGYQIGRNQDDYPLFIDVYDDEIDDWEDHFERFGIDHSVGERSSEADGIHFVLYPTEDFETEWVENASVPPLEETVEWARQYEANFQPALEMLDGMYDLGLGVTYRERETL